MDFQMVCEGLRFPEGPVWMEDGSIILVEIEAGRVTRIQPNGDKEVVAHTGGGPNGAAIGPDGLLYVCNSGGMNFFEANGVLMTHGQAGDGYTRGSIDRVNLSTGQVERLYDWADDRQLFSPNDIVFDRHGGFWFSDFGKQIGNQNNAGGIFYATPDGQHIRRVVEGMNVNGIGLSPDDTILYAALTNERLILAYDILAPGEIDAPLSGGRVVSSFPGRQLLDSMAIASDGTICVGSLADAQGIALVDPLSGEHRLRPFPDFYTTNICFGGPDMQDAWITLSTTGRLIKTRLGKAGHRLAYYA